MVRLFAFIGILLFAQIQPNAQTATLPSRMTIEEAVQEAIGNNLGLLAERYNITSAEARVITARLHPNPVFSFGLDYLDILGTGFNGINNAGPSEIDFRTDFILEGAGKRKNRVAVAQGNVDVVRAQFLESTRQIKLDVENACIELISASLSLDLAQQNMKTFNEILEVNQTRVKAGDLAAVELVRSKVAALQYANSVLQAETRLRIARGKLQYLLGRRPGAPIESILGDLRRDGSIPSLEQIKIQALVNRPDLISLRLDKIRAQAELRSQIAQSKIDWTVGTEYHRQYDNADGNSMGFFLSIPIPIFSRNQGEIQRARQEMSQIDARIEALQSNIINEVETSFIQCQAANTLLLNIEANMLKAAKEVRQTTEYSYKRGEASFVEFLDSQRAFNDTIQSYNEARAEFARSLYLIESITGKGVVP